MCGTGLEYGKLKDIDTFAYPDAEFTEFKRGQYLATVCENKSL